MSNFKSIVNAINSRFVAQIIANVTGGLPTQYQNDPYEKPENARWARVAVLPGASLQVSLGENKRFRNTGLVVVSVFIPATEGIAEAYDIADLIDDEDGFRNVTAGGVKYLKPRLQVVGLTGDEWQLNVVCPYQADDIES